jgi:hypothetical protein
MSFFGLEVDRILTHELNMQAGTKQLAQLPVPTLPRSQEAVFFST